MFCFIIIILYFISDSHGLDRMVVGFKATYVISTYHHLRCEFESHLGEVYSIQHIVIKVCQWLATGRWFLPPIKLYLFIFFHSPFIMLHSIIKCRKVDQTNWKRQLLKENAQHIYNRQKKKKLKKKKRILLRIQILRPYSFRP
jgi:hypothetical protein